MIKVLLISAYDPYIICTLESFKPITITVVGVEFTTHTH